MVDQENKFINKYFEILMSLPVMIKVLVLGSMVGSLLRCCLTCSRYCRLWFCLLMMVAILPSAALLSCLHRYKESPNLRSRT